MISPQKLFGARPFGFRFSLRMLLVVITAFAVIFAARIHLENRLARVPKRGITVTGRVPALVFRPQVSYLDLSGSGITDAHLDDWTSSHSMRELNLAGTQVTDDGLMQLRRMRSLTRLMLNDTGIGDEGLSQLAHMPDLQVLSLSNTRVTDQGLLALAGLEHLSELHLDGTGVTDAGLAHLKGMATLRHLGLDQSQLTSDSAAVLRKLPNLERVRVRVSSGLGKAARDQLTSLKGARVSGYLASCGARLWDSQFDWKDSTAGLCEVIVNEANLDPDGTTVLVDVLAKECPSGLWKPTKPSSNANLGLAAPEALRDDREFLQAIIAGDNESLARARRYVESGAASDPAALLRLLETSPTDSYAQRLRERVAFFLVRMDSNTDEVLAALQRLTEDDDASIRALVFKAFHARPTPTWIATQRTVQPWSLDSDMAAAVLPWIRRGAGDDDPLVSTTAIQALESLTGCLREAVNRQPQHLESIVHELLALLANRKPWVRWKAERVLIEIAHGVHERTDGLGGP